MFPITIVVLLGGVSGLALSRLKWPLLVRTLAAAVLAALTWGAGTYLFMWIAAPNELGLPLLKPVLLTCLIAIPSALLAGWAAARARENAMTQGDAQGEERTPVRQSD